MLTMKIRCWVDLSVTRHHVRHTRSLAVRLYAWRGLVPSVAVGSGCNLARRPPPKQTSSAATEGFDSGLLAGLGATAGLGYESTAKCCRY